MTVVGCTLEAVEQEEKDHNDLEKSLEDQHDTVHSISNFIYVETEKQQQQQLQQSQSTSNEVKSEIDLEGQLMALGERWTVLCTWVEERAEILRITRDELELLEREKDRLTGWLDKRENALRDMDRNPSDNPEDLLRQGQLIAVKKLFFFKETEHCVKRLSTISHLPIIDQFLKFKIANEVGGKK